jgi:hypothetical protein
MGPHVSLSFAFSLLFSPLLLFVGAGQPVSDNYSRMAGPGRPPHARVVAGCAWQATARAGSGRRGLARRWGAADGAWRGGAEHVLRPPARFVLFAIESSGTQVSAAAGGSWADPWPSGTQVPAAADRSWADPWLSMPVGI